MKPQQLPHHGVANGYTRTGKRVCTKPETKDDNGNAIPAHYQHFPSVSKAKHFMRTGE